MKTWKKAICIALVGLGYSYIDGIVMPYNGYITPLVKAAEMAPMVDTWILSYDGVHYYIKGGTLQIEPTTKRHHEWEYYRFQVQLISVYPNGNHEAHHYEMKSGGLPSFSVDGGPRVVADPRIPTYRVYDEIFWTIVNKYIR